MAETETLFHPAAADEYAQAFDWYWQRSRAVAQPFEAEVERALELISEAPGRWPSHDSKHRKLVLRRFPFLIVYREVGDRIWVVAVAHGHRRPGYWRDRGAGAP